MPAPSPRNWRMLLRSVVLSMLRSLLHGCSGKDTLTARSNDVAARTNANRSAIKPMRFASPKPGSNRR